METHTLLTLRHTQYLSALVRHSSKGCFIVKPECEHLLELLFHMWIRAEMLRAFLTVTSRHFIFWKERRTRVIKLPMLGLSWTAQWLRLCVRSTLDWFLFSAIAKLGWTSYTVTPPLLSSASYLRADEWVLTIPLGTCPQAHTSLLHPVFSSSPVIAVNDGSSATGVYQYPRLALWTQYSSSLTLCMRFSAGHFLRQQWNAARSTASWHRNQQGGRRRCGAGFLSGCLVMRAGGTCRNECGNYAALWATGPWWILSLNYGAHYSQHAATLTMAILLSVCVCVVWAVTCLVRRNWLYPQAIVFVCLCERGWVC